MQDQFNEPSDSLINHIKIAKIKVEQNSHPVMEEKDKIVSNIDGEGKK